MIQSDLHAAQSAFMPHPHSISLSHIHILAITRDGENHLNSLESPKRHPGHKNHPASTPSSSSQPPPHHPPPAIQPQHHHHVIHTSQRQNPGHLWRSANLLIPAKTTLKSRKINPGGNSSKHQKIIPISKRRANIRNPKGNHKPPRKSNPKYPTWDAPTETPRTSCAGTRRALSFSSPD
jgi:hypothetical protein